MLLIFCWFPDLWLGRQPHPPQIVHLLLGHLRNRSQQVWEVLLLLRLVLPAQAQVGVLLVAHEGV